MYGPITPRPPDPGAAPFAAALRAQPPLVLQSYAFAQAISTLSLDDQIRVADAWTTAIDRDAREAREAATIAALVARIDPR